MWNQKLKLRLGLPLPCLEPTGRLESLYFFTPTPQRGLRASVPELHKNVSCWEARDLLGPTGPSRHVCLSLICVCVQFGFVFFIWQEEGASE